MLRIWRSERPAPSPRRLQAPFRQTGNARSRWSGGDTPRALYATLAARFDESLPWKHVHLFWGDERFLPAGDPRRNETMARESLLNHVPCPAEHIHPVACGCRQFCRGGSNGYKGDPPGPRFPPNGRGSISCCSGSAPMATRLRCSLAPPLSTKRRDGPSTSTAPADPRSRVTLTLPVLNSAALTFFLVSGAEKADALRRVLAGADTRMLPAAGIRP